MKNLKEFLTERSKINKKAAIELAQAFINEIGTDSKFDNTEMEAAYEWAGNILQEIAYNCSDHKLAALAQTAIADDWTDMDDRLGIYVDALVTIANS